ncbi:MAG: hypothetical protein KBC84_04970, partial [Proteobacteria bacterium]|nr:hypothetical protein [Pseudomonadota bacterium]
FMTEVIKEELSSRDRMLKKEDLSLLPTIASDLINSKVYGNNFMLVSELFTIYLNFYSSYTKLNDFFDKIEVFNQLNSQITLKADNIFDLAKDFRFISLNTAIQSEKLGNNSNTLSVVASNMEESSKHVLANIDDLKAEVARFRLYMEQLVFDISASKLQIEMMLFFIYEVIESLKLENMGEKDSKQIIDSFRERFTVLSKSFQISYQNITKSLHEIQNKTLTLIDVTNFLNQKVISLKFGQIEGLIEANRINQGSSFGVVFKDINRQLDRVRDEYSGLNLNIQEIKSMIVDAPYKLDYISGSFEKSIEKMNNLS